MIITFIDSLSSFEADVIHFFQRAQNPFFDYFFKGITYLGDTYFFIALVAFIYWIVDKRFAHKFACGFIGSSLFTGVIKVAVGRVRPYTAYADKVKMIQSEPEGSNSFPSGHSTSTGSISTAMYTGYNKKFRWLKWVLLAYMILVPLSRIYLGVHYPSDVLTGLLTGILITLLVFKVVDLMGDNEHIWSLLAIPLFLIVIILCEVWLKNEVSAESLHDIYVASGGFIGFLGGYFIEKKYVRMDVRNKPLFQVLKYLLGIGVAFGIQQGLKVLFEKINPEFLLLDFVRYMVIGVWASLLAPLIFKKIFRNAQAADNDNKEEV